MYIHRSGCIVQSNLTATSVTSVLIHAKGAVEFSYISSQLNCLNDSCNQLTIISSADVL